MAKSIEARIEALEARQKAQRRADRPAVVFIDPGGRESAKAAAADVVVILPPRGGDTGPDKAA